MKLGESSHPRLSRTRAVIPGRPALLDRRQIPLLRLRSRFRWALTGIWAVWTSHWTQICGCSWIHSHTVSPHAETRTEGEQITDE
jgi:hypothetical protein